MKKDRVFYAKLLLFGEYTVLNGSESLAMPLTNYRLSYVHNDMDNFSGILWDLYQYIISKDFKKDGVFFKSAEYRESLQNGLFFSSDIPIGFGLGSSGALTAAVFYRFFSYPPKLELHELQTILAKIESFFHGKSSGMDPLISYLNKAIHVGPHARIELIDFDPSVLGDLKIYLIDSGIPRSTEHFVSIFRNKLLDPHFTDTYLRKLTELNDLIIRKINFKESPVSIHYDIKALSGIQYKTFPEMIPFVMHELWEKTLSSNDHIMKLCGAGGGGFFLLFSRNIDSFKMQFPNSKIVHILT